MTNLKNMRQLLLAWEGKPKHQNALRRQDSMARREGGLVRIPLTRGQWAIVDDEDYEIISRVKWIARPCLNTIYAEGVFPHQGKEIRVSMHRLILNAVRGQIVDHIDMDGLNNRRSNLRFCTHSENMRNMRIRKNNTSGFRGVCWCNTHKYFVSYISVNKNRITIGRFKAAIEAAKSYNECAVKYHGAFASLNKIP